MLWILFSILASLCDSIANIIDKYVLTKWVRKPLVPVIVSGVMWLGASTIVYFIYGFSYLSYFNIFLAVLAGILTTLLYIFYFKALQIEEASRIVPLFYLSPLFILILAAIFLNEFFTPLKYFGIFLLIIGAILLSTKNLSKISFGRAFWWMVLAAGFGSIDAVLIKYLLNLTDFWTMFSYKGLGMAIGSISITYFYLPELIETVKRHGKKVIITMSVSETLGIFSILFLIIATSIGYVTLVNALSSIQPFFILLFTIILSIFYPRILKEKVSKAIISQKILAIILMFIGIILIT